MQRISDNRFLRFVLVGALNSLFGFAAFSAFVLMGSPNWVAILVGNLSGIGFNFLTTGGLVFRQRALNRFPRFVICYAILFILNNAALYWLEPWVGHKLAAQALLTIPLAALAYVIMSFWVFKPS